jgi:hypothetical protein
MAFIRFAKDLCSRHFSPHILNTFSTHALLSTLRMETGTPSETLVNICQKIKTFSVTPYITDGLSFSLQHPSSCNKKFFTHLIVRVINSV